MPLQLGRSECHPVGLSSRKTVLGEQRALLLLKHGALTATKSTTVPVRNMIPTADCIEDKRIKQRAIS
jgi:hypothetical protein